MQDVASLRSEECMPDMLKLVCQGKYLHILKYKIDKNHSDRQNNPTGNIYMHNLYMDVEIYVGHQGRHPPHYH